MTRLNKILGEGDEQEKISKLGENEDGSLPDDLPMGHQELHYPDISEVANYLVSLFHSAGMATPTGMGLVGLSYQELESWAKLAGMENILEPWQYTGIYTMSRAYANECSAATKKDSRAPYIPVEEIEIDREIVNDQVEDVFASILASQRG